jgi:hypothetical protein
VRITLQESTDNLFWPHYYTKHETFKKLNFLQLIYNWQYTFPKESHTDHFVQNKIHDMHNQEVLFAYNKMLYIFVKRVNEIIANFFIYFLKFASI